MNVAVLLSGCGVYDGAEIHESVLSLLALKQAGFSYQCVGIDGLQYHVVNHHTGEEMPESRNMLVEAARIARGQIMEIRSVAMSQFDALWIPGGFGSAKNFSTWAFHGTEGTVHPEVARLIVEALSLKKPIVALCISPVVVAKALSESSNSALLTAGSVHDQSPYDILGTHAAMVRLGQKTQDAGVEEVVIDEQWSIITTPCYMMEAGIDEIFKGIQGAVDALKARFS